MTTAETIISRLPASPTISPLDIAIAAGMRSAVGVINAIQSGKISAVKIGGRFVIARAAAIDYINKCAREARK